MANFLDTQGVSYYLKKLIDNSNEKLYLISPYLKINNQLKLSLADRHKFSIDIIIIYGKDENINSDNSEWLETMPGIKIMYHTDLHAKCYFNEKEAIITSMNLHMFSQQNNVEMGIYLTKEKDEELYIQIATEIERIKRGSEHKPITIQRVESRKNNPNKLTTPHDSHKTYKVGYCIRTGIEIPFDLKKPLSTDAYKKWNEYGDKDYQEKFCHFSGEPSNGETSFNQPILKKNWKKAKELHNF